MKIFFTFIAVLLLSGCQYLAPLVTKSAEYIGGGVAEYCANVPDSERPDFKAKVEAECDEAAGGTGCQVELTCPTVQ